MRERAQQSCPALSKTAHGAARAAASTSASANTMFADLPPSSSVTRLIVAAAEAAIDAPTSVEPVKAIFPTPGCSTSRCPQVRPGPTTTLTTPSGTPAAAAISAKRTAVSGVSSAGFSTTVLPAASAGASFQEAIASGKFHGVMRPDDADRLAERHRDAPVDRDRVAQEPLRRAGEVAEGRDRAADLAAGGLDRLAGVARLEQRELLVGVLERRREVAQDAGARAGCERPPRGQRLRRAGDRLVGLGDAGAGEGLQDPLGRRLQDGQRLAHAAQCGKGPSAHAIARTAPSGPPCGGPDVARVLRAYGASGNFGGSPISAARAAASSSAGEWNVLLPLTAQRMAAKMITAVTVTGA